MTLDPRVLRRLDELLARSESILAARELEYTHTNGNKIYKISAPDVNGWATSVLNLLQRAFGTDSVHYKTFAEQSHQFSGHEPSMRMLAAILRAAKEDFEGGYLFNLKGLVKAEVLTDALDQAEELLKSGYKDPACVLAGVSLEIAIKELAERSGVPAGKLNRMNADLVKAAAYNLARQQQITAWAELRNKAAHGDWTEYDSADVGLMLAGVRAFIADKL